LVTAWRSSFSSAFESDGYLASPGLAEREVGAVSRVSREARFTEAFSDARRQMK
jgi:hypothetical protein